MVLKNSFQSGITLIELLLAMALSGLIATLALALFRDAGHASRLIQSHQTEGLQTQSFFFSLCENLLGGRGVLKLSENRLLLLNKGNQWVDYTWEDSTLCINGKAQPMRISEFKIEAFGPDKPAPIGSFRALEEPWELDSLDENRDGQITFQELDRDQDDSLSMEECQFVSRYALTLTTIDRNLATTLKALVHPRNHLSGEAVQSWEMKEFADENASF